MYIVRIFDGVKIFRKSGGAIRFSLAADLHILVFEDPACAGLVATIL